jgi:crossover junction endodeoxyribonuclease RusA
MSSEASAFVAALDIHVPMWKGFDIAIRWSDLHPRLGLPHANRRHVSGSGHNVEMATSVTLSLVLPLPPSVNNQYVTVGNRRVLSKPARAFRKDVEVLFERLRTKGELAPATEKALQKSLLGIYLTFYFTSPMRRDLDGGLKISLDALGDCLGFDDRRVVDLHLTKQIDPLHPRLEVEIETISGWTFDQEFIYLGEPDANVDPDE